jgi:hypothetical protein
MAVLSVDTFKSRLVGGGARPNLFEVRLTFPTALGITNPAEAEKTSLMVKGASLPASTIAPIPVPFRGRVLQIAGDRTFDPWTVTIINDTDFEIRNAMEQWMDGMNSHSKNTGEINPGNYQADLEVDQLDKNETAIKGYKFVGCFPSAVSEIDLQYDTNDTIEEFTVEFQVQYWTSNTTS